MRHLLVLLVVFGSLFAHSQTSEPPPVASIKGTVTDQNGNLISAATVYAVPQGLTLNDITPRLVRTDRNGEFDFRGGFPLGVYKLYSRKEEAAYPDPLDRFYADGKAEAPQVDLTVGHPSATVTVNLGEKAGVIAGRVIDADTGHLQKARLVFLDAEGHGHAVSVDGNYRVLLPPGRNVTLMVTVLGSHSDRSHLPVAPLRLEPGQEIYMDIPVSQR